MKFVEFVPAVVDASDAANLPRPRIVIHVRRGEDPGVSFYWPLPSPWGSLHHRYSIVGVNSAHDDGEVESPPPSDIIETVKHELAQFSRTGVQP